MASSKEFVCTGSKSEPPPHGKTEIKMEITPNELGPLSLFEGKHDSNFLGGHYWITTPKGEYLVLGFMVAVPRSSGSTGRLINALEDWWIAWTLLFNSTGIAWRRKLLWLYPKECYSTKALPQLSGSQVFIPYTVVKALQHWQTKKHEYDTKGTNKRELLEAEQRWREAQRDILKQWNLKRLETIHSDVHNTALKGSHFRSLSPQIQKFMRNARNGSSLLSSGNIQEGTYKVH